MSESITLIPARLKNAADGGHVAGASDIIDDTLNKTQAELNSPATQDSVASTDYVELRDMNNIPFKISAENFNNAVFSAFNTWIQTKNRGTYFDRVLTISTGNNIGYSTLVDFLSTLAKNEIETFKENLIYKYSSVAANGTFVIPCLVGNRVSLSALITETGDIAILRTSWSSNEYIHKTGVFESNMPVSLSIIDEQGNYNWVLTNNTGSTVELKCISFVWNTGN